VKEEDSTRKRSGR